MTEIDISLTDEELVQEVRDALAGIDDSKVPDDTIIQTANRFVIPLLNDISSVNIDNQDRFDSVVISWTAELSFDAWLTFTRLRDREIETFIDAKQYQRQLEKRTNMSLKLIGASRPPEIPNVVYTVKHDGKKRKIDLQKPWVLE